MKEPIPGDRLMEHISLYRKWRPQGFDEVVGQRPVTETLANALSAGRIVHAYLFTGPRGTGKTSTARILAKAINCINGPTAVPCNQCEACVSISEGTALDVIEIDAASNRKIDEIRDLLEKIPYSPVSLRKKLYIIDEVHQLTPEASSALLKTLEEPPAHVIFVLATTDPQKLLPTIVSRCQRFEFGTVTAREIAGLLRRIASDERIGIEEDAIGMIAEHARGSVRDAVGVMDQVSNIPGESITREQLAELIGEVETGALLRMVDLISDGDAGGALGLAGGLFEQGKDPYRFLEALISHLRDLFLMQNAANPEQIIDATDEHFGRIGEQANVLSRHEVLKLINAFGTAYREMRQSENPRIILECELVRQTSKDADVTTEGLAFRVEELERKIEALSSGAAPAPRPVQAGVAGIRTEVTPPPAPAPKAVPSAPAPRKKAADAVRPPAPEGPPAAEGGAEKTGPERSEKVRRAWMAVMGEVKRSGDLKLFSLLTRARLAGLEGKALTIQFPPEAQLHRDLFMESGENIETVEELWERFFGEAATLTVENGPEPGDEQPEKTKTVNTPAPRREKKQGVEEQAPAGPAQEEAPVETGADPEAKRTEELARLLSESFDGEVVPTEREGE